MRRRMLVSLMVCVMCALGCGADTPKKDGGTAGSGAAGDAANAGTGTAGDAAGSGNTAGASAGTPAAGSGAVDPGVQSIFDTGCASASVKSDLLPTNILFVIDRSGSMGCNPPPTTASDACEANPMQADTAKPTKWEITSTALVDALKTLPANATVGVSYFSNDDNCGVSSQPTVPLALNSAAQQSTIEASLTGSTPSGGTPIVGATILAYKHMHESALSGSISGNEFVVLITDGQQSEQCSDMDVCSGADECTTLLVDKEVPRAAGKGVGIRTFVIGVPGSEPARTVLSAIAKNGGTAADGCSTAKGDCHFDMTKETDLSKALAAALVKITGQTITCELPVPRPTEGDLDPTLVNVVYTPSKGGAAMVVKQDTSKACDAGAEGWQYIEANTKIRLCGAICDSVRADTGAKVDVVLGCPAVLE